MEYLPWFAWIAIAGIAAFALTQVAAQLGRRRPAPAEDHLLKAAQESRENNLAMIARLEQIEGRLSAMERGR